MELGVVNKCNRLNNFVLNLLMRRCCPHLIVVKLKRHVLFYFVKFCAQLSGQ